MNLARVPFFQAPKFFKRGCPFKPVLPRTVATIASRPSQRCHRRRSVEKDSIAYFSMEIGLTNKMPTYSGGLGMLAGDYLKTAADLRIPMVGISLLHRHGYFKQVLDQNGSQSESPVKWDPKEFLEPLDARVLVKLEGRDVHLRPWVYWIKGINGYKLPAYFLDSLLDKNTEWDQNLTGALYGGDNHYRLCQEVILGLGGLEILKALGHTGIRRFHMNEGHSALLTVGLLEDLFHSNEGKDQDMPALVGKVREQCVFTTHTPVEAGHDKFSWEMVAQVLGKRRTGLIGSFFDHPVSCLNLTELGFGSSHYVNGVSRKHGEVTRDMFPGHPVDSITNGVHIPTWVSEPMQRLFDRKIPRWQSSNAILRQAISAFDLHDLAEAHRQAKERLIEVINERAETPFCPQFLTFGFARRVIPYKRQNLLFHDINKLIGIANLIGPLQFVFAGKAHPHDNPGKDLIRTLYLIRDAIRKKAGDVIRIEFLENYNMDLGKLMVGGVDVWVNTPQKPREASGTSGMKAAANGVPCLSVLDGWWMEAFFDEGSTGWAIGSAEGQGEDIHQERKGLYRNMEAIARLYYEEPMEFAKIMRKAIAINGSYFHMQRVMAEYLVRAYHIQ